MWSSDEEKRSTISEAWLMQAPPEVPFMIEVGEAHYATARYLADTAADLAEQEQRCRMLSAVDDYFIPHIKPNLGIGVMAAAFGCKWVADPRRDPWITPIITDDPDDVFRLQMPDLAHSGMNGLALERIDYMQAHTGLPLHLVNVPSPLVTASLIWKYDSFLAATITHRRAVHALLDLVTEATIGFVRLQLRQIKRLFALTHQPWYIPHELGIRISDDTAAVLSPAAYREFGVPYNARISRAFGGIIVHSCGSITHVLPAMLTTPGLRGIDLAAPQNNLQEVRDIIQGRTALSLRYYSWDFPDAECGDLVEYSRSLVECFGRRGLILWTQVPTLTEAQALAQGLHGILRN